MTEPVRITIPAAVAAYLRTGIPVEERLRYASGEVALSSRDLVLLLFCLGSDAEQQVRQRAFLTLQGLPDDCFDDLPAWEVPHPAVLHAVARACGQRDVVRSALLAHPALAEQTAAVLRRYESAPPALPEGNEHQPGPAAQDLPGVDLPAEASAEAEESGNGDDEEESESEESEESEEYLSKFKLAQTMGIAEKIKTALTGDKEWRKILIKDSNKLVSSGVLKNPRITESEVLTVLKSGVQNDEIMRLICANKEWVKNYQIRKALIENPKTPLASALRFLGTMNEKDVAGYAKSRNISSVLATQAKRMLLNKKRA